MALLKYWDGSKYVAFGGKEAEEVEVRPDQPPSGPELWLDTDDPVFTSAQADALYLQSSNGAMTGPLTLTVDPSDPADAVSKQYADQLVTVSGEAAPSDAPRDGVLWVQLVQPSTTTLVASETTVTVGDTVTLTADTTADVGAIQFLEAGIASGTPVPVGADGIATKDVIPTRVGNIVYAAEYQPAGPWDTSRSPNVTVTVTPQLSPVTLSVNDTSPYKGDPVTLTAMVIADVGTLQFTENDVPLGSPITITAPGDYPMQDTPADTGSTTYAAVYTGGGAEWPDTTDTVYVSPIGKTTAMTWFENGGSDANTAVTLDVSVSASAPVTQGTVTFYWAGSAISGAIPMNASGHAIFAWTTPGGSATSNTLEARYTDPTGYYKDTKITTSKTYKWVVTGSYSVTPTSGGTSNAGGTDFTWSVHWTSNGGGVPPGKCSWKVTKVSTGTVYTCGLQETIDASGNAGDLWYGFDDSYKGTAPTWVSYNGNNNAFKSTADSNKINIVLS